MVVSRQTIEHGPPWKVLLIGGGSGVGKSQTARQVARHYGCALSEVDDVRLVLQRVTTPAQQPALHALLEPAAWQTEPELLMERMIAVAEVISHALEIVIANHVATNVPIVLEGDSILPQLAVQRFFANRTTEPSEVRAVFLYEADEAQLWRNAEERGRGFQQLSPELQQANIRLAWLYGQWLQREASEIGVPVLPARPWESLAARVIKTVALTQ